VAAVIAVMLIYAVRHWIFTISRVMWRQRPSYQDLYTNELPGVTVIVPMHDEGSVARKSLEALVRCDYPQELLEIIPVDDQSDDETTVILHEYSRRYSFIRPVYLLRGPRGKPQGLNTALELAHHEIVFVFDADYTPGRGLLRELAMAFSDPQVGAVMGRVVPRNTGDNLLTRLLTLERSGGYQVDQQARYNLDLLPQYGGTVGGFRRSVITELGGFDPETLAEDTDLTVRLYVAGWKVVYANHAECYEEVPQSWDVRFKQLRRWSRGHNKAFFKNAATLLASPRLTAVQKVDALLLLGVYAIPPVLFSGIAANALLFMMGAVPIWSTMFLSFFAVCYGSFGNFGPIYEVGAAELLDGACERIYLLPYLFYLFLFNAWAVTAGLLDFIGDTLRRAAPTWEKTARNA
jgi:cellulose synthase/poly-beta-1,6-N-acetylglucosamine synthase-like glycosyltransferase